MLNVKIHAIGRLKSGPERDLYERYAERAQQSGKPLGIAALGLKESPESRAKGANERKKEEAATLLASIPDNAFVIALDERGKTQSSEKFANTISTLRDDGCQNLFILIGGADGHDESIRQRANKVLCFGEMTWPHQIVRILLAEQIYRAFSILAGHPYHKS